MQTAVNEKTEKTVTEVTCPECGADRRQLREWLNEPLVWELYPNLEAGGTWLKSENCQKAHQIIWNCPLCRLHFHGEG